MGTGENLRAAFAGESQANRRYLAYARKAEEDGFPQVARLFRAVADAETVHAHAHLRVLNEVRTTEENLQEAIAGERHESDVMYPSFLQEAEEEGNKRAVASLRNALAVERIHHRLYTEALNAVQAGQDLVATTVYVCDVCGNTVVGQPPDRCAVCNAPRVRFFEVK